MNFDRNDLIESLNAAFAETFEGLAFLEFDQWEEVNRIIESADKQYVTSVNITNPFKAGISLICSEQFILNIIESITGDETRADESEVSDTLKEILNTLAGRFMAKLLSNSSEFNFGIPDFQMLKFDSIESTASNIILKFDYDYESAFCVYKLN